ncbi:MAG: electron transfer flavoprotein subunit alpha/FixB family protein [Actinomycetales bacterium]
MSALVYVESELDGGLSEVSRETLTFARSLDSDVQAVHVGQVADAAAAQLAAQGVSVVHVAVGADLAAYSGAAHAAAVVQAVNASGANALLAAGSPRGMEVLAHCAVRLGVSMAANVVAIESGAPGADLVVDRQVVSGSVVEQMQLPGAIAVLTVAGHAVAERAAEAAGVAAVQEFSPAIEAKDVVAAVRRTSDPEPDLTGALKTAKVVVGGGRGVGGPDGFDDLIELAGKLDGVLGVSRVVTSLGWRPHHEQVGQTGSRISPDLYVAAGISGAIQHWAGCSSSKAILAINTDEDAPMVTKATYAVIGDLHEVVPAVNEAIASR